MEKPDILALARAAGLGKALREFRDDVIAAAHAAEHARSGFDEPRDPTTEPWPPMRVCPSPPPSAGTRSEGDKS